jgi:hypothetical protein
LLDLPANFDFGTVVKFLRERLPVDGVGDPDVAGGITNATATSGVSKEYRKLYSAELRQLSEWGVSANIYQDRMPYSGP